PMRRLRRQRNRRAPRRNSLTRLNSGASLEAVEGCAYSACASHRPAPEYHCLPFRFLTQSNFNRNRDFASPAPGQ
ncbi:hypothetical protein, partial [Mesorhizobium sanjuanii]|uniref:hypothetical protein n=1 Tax=Mesorhizobium sanjuanii TaxID=2037900 RepID=UPI001AD815D5